MPKTAWNQHVSKVAKQNPKKSFAQVTKLASQTYHPTAKRGGFGVKNARAIFDNLPEGIQKSAKKTAKKTFQKGLKKGLSGLARAVASGL
jgi:hypothetical protein